MKRTFSLLVTIGFVAGLGGCLDFDRFRVVREDSGVPANEAGADDDAGSLPPPGTECTNDDGCDDLEFCTSAGACESRRPNAEDCSGATQCLSGYCDPDGICCTAGEDCCDSDSECAGEYRCDVAARECFSECTNANETSACKDAGHCSVALHCVADLAVGAANACTRDTMCAGNANCVDGFCCDGGCAGCFVCNAPGSLGVCTAAGGGSDPKNVCAPSGCARDGSCDGAGGCTVVAAGTDPNNACSPSACTNDGTCNGSGGCRVVAAGTDPNNACLGTTASCNFGDCNGNGSCAPRPEGTTCAGGNCGSARCSSGSCIDACTLSGEAACEFCSGDAAWACGGC